MFGNRQWFLPTGCSRLLPGIPENSIQHVHTRKAADDQMWCKLGILPAWCKFVINLYQASLIVSSSCVTSVKIRLQLDIYWLTWVVETTCIKLVDKKLWQLICIKHIWQLAADLLPASMSNGWAWWLQGNKPAANCSKLSIAWAATSHLTLKWP